MKNIYVPITVKALPVGDWYMKDWCADFSDDYSRMSFDVLGEYIRGNLVTRNDMPKGVHLHWSIPDALTEGKQSDSADKSRVVYPSVPNRWQITRIWVHDSKIKTAHFIVESDFKAQSLNKYNSGSPTWAMGRSGFAYIGRSFPAGEKPDGGSEYLDEFTVSTSGNPLNTAFYPSCRNVFGFYDDLTDNGERLTNVELTYCICGRYGNEKNDILFPYKEKEGLLKRLEELGWRLPDEAADELDYPCNTIFHGMICGIKWTDDETLYQSADNAQTPDVAVANTSPEAIAALLANYDTKFSKDKPIEYSGQVDERMLLHLLCGKQTDITELDGIIRSENGIHESFFTHSSGEKRYELKAKSKKNDEPEIIPDSLSSILKDLNIIEKEKFFIKSEYSHYCELLFDNLYLAVKCNELKTRSDVRLTGVDSLSDEYAVVRKTSNEYAQKISECTGRIKALICKLDALGKEYKDKDACANKYIEEIKKSADFELNEQSGERFWEPNNPALLLSRIDRDLSHGCDSSFETEGTMLVRIKTVKSLNLDDDEIFTANPENITDALFPNLIKESILLTPAFAEAICGSAETAARLMKLQLAPYAVADTSETNVDEIGEELMFGEPPPSKVAVTYYTEAWYPLYLEWQILFFPDKNTLAKVPNLNAWKMSGGYDYSCIDTSVFSKIGLSMSGRTFLTAYTARFLSEKLKEIELTVPGAAWMEVLSQIMGSFNSQLLMHDLKLIPDIEKITELYCNRFGGSAFVMRGLLSGEVVRYPAFDTHFSPLRAGFISIERISVIDSFGRLRQYRPDDCYTAEAMRFPIKKVPNHVLMPPRITQPSRLSFKWDDSAVAAWLMPNFFDSSLSVYNAEGEHICQLYAGLEKTTVRLSPRFGGKECKNLAEVISDLDLLGFLSELAVGERLKTFLEYANDSLERINTPQSRGAYAAGRPLVLTRGRVSLELRDPPKLYKSFMAAERHIDIEQLNVPLKIGQTANNHDGTIGFFVGKNYAKMFLPTIINSTENYFIQNGIFNVHPRFNNPEWVDITILLDPYAEINLITGLLPVKTIRLNEAVVAERAEKLYHLFFVAPLISGDNDIALPLPVVEKMRWVWLENQGDVIVEKEAEKANPEAVFKSSVVYAREGWLTLTAEQGEDGDI